MGHKSCFSFKADCAEMSNIKCVRFVSIWMISLVFISRDNLSHQYHHMQTQPTKQVIYLTCYTISSMHLTSCINSGMVFPVHTTGNYLVSRSWSCAALGSLFWPSLENLFSLLSQRMALLLLISMHTHRYHIFLYNLIFMPILCLCREVAMSKFSFHSCEFSGVV